MFPPIEIHHEQCVAMRGLPTPQGHLANIICLRQISAGRNVTDSGRSSGEHAKCSGCLFQSDAELPTAGAKAISVLLKEKPGPLGGEGTSGQE